jgi:uncharacterized protein YegP (UPF0339 family)
LTRYSSVRKLTELAMTPAGRLRMAYKFEVYKDKKGEFRFRFKAPNGETMFSSEGYKAKPSAMSAIESIKKNAPVADIDDQTKAAPAPVDKSAAKPAAAAKAAAKPPAAKPPVAKPSVE